MAPEGYEIRNAFTPTRPTFLNIEQPQSRSFIGNVTTTRGNHTLKFGGEYRQVHIDVGNGPGISVRWNSIADFLANRTNRIRVDGELPLQEGRRWYGIGYAQDRVARRRHARRINAGLRYEYYSVMKEASGRGNVLDLERCPPTATSIYLPAGHAVLLSRQEQRRAAARHGVDTAAGVGVARRLWPLLQPRPERRRDGGDRQPGARAAT